MACANSKRVDAAGHVPAGRARIRSRLPRPCALTLAIVLAIAATPLWAQGSARGGDGAQAQAQAQAASENTPPAKPAAKPTPSKQDVTRLQTVTVTATRRRLDIDKVPIAITAISGDELRDSGVVDTQSLPMVDPALVITTSGNEGASVVRLRGIGTSATNPGLEGSVGVMIDGVYQPRAGLALSDLVDISRVDVLRGPQSTLFGANTSAGVINIHTNKPTFYNEGHVSASAGNFDRTTVTGVWSGPVSKALALRLSAHYDRGDGYITNTFDGQSYNNRNRGQLRAQALWRPNDDFSLRLIGDVIRKHERCCAAPYTKYGPTAPFLRLLGATLPPISDDYRVSFNRPVGSNLDSDALTALMDWNLGWATAKATLGYVDSRSHVHSDGDFNNLDLVYLPENNDGVITKSADFTLQNGSHRVDWLVGLYFNRIDLEHDGSTLLGKDAGYFLLGALPPAPIPPLYPVDSGQQQILARQQGKTWALYTHNIVHFDHGIDLTLGLRYVNETKDGFGLATSNSPSCVIPGLPAAARVLCAVPRYDAHYSDNRTVGVAALSKQLRAGGTLYLSYSTGFKAGGINLDPSNAAASVPVFRPETVRAYELGFKQPLFDRHFFLHADVYDEQFKDVQLNTYNGLYFVIANAASARSRGVEAQGDWYLAPGYKLSLGYTHNLATYGQDAATAALRGQQLTNAPKNSGTLGFYFDRPLGSRRLFGSLAARYQSAVNTGSDLNPAKRQGGYTLLNATLGLQFGENFRVSLWGRNLTNRYYNQIIFDSVVQTGSYNGYPGMPRTFGVDVRWDF
jgi:outer membrane receptor protein involved in Fe transport